MVEVWTSKNLYAPDITKRGGEIHTISIVQTQIVLRLGMPFSEKKSGFWVKV